MKSRTKIDQAKDLIIAELSNAPSSSIRMVRIARKQGISRFVLYRAAGLLDVCKKSTGYGHDKVSVWSIGTDELQRLISLHSYVERQYSKVLFNLDQAIAQSPTPKDASSLESLRAVIARHRKKSVQN